MSIKVCLRPEDTNAIKACYATGFKRAFLYRELPGRLKYSIRGAPFIV